MHLRRILLTLALAPLALAEPCPKVNTTTQTPATMRAIVKSINCLVDSSSGPSSGSSAIPAAFRLADGRGGAQVDTLPIIGPQHTRTYSGLVLAILTMPVDGTQKAAIVTPDAPVTTLRGASGGECKLKLDSDRSVDAVCNQAGGTVFVVYR
jgi:hypothetical protein